MHVPPQEISDVVQEAYLRIARMDSVSHIRNGRAYLFTAARALVLERIRHERVVRIDNMTEVQALSIVDDDPDPERMVGARQELQRIRDLIDGLPARCREIFTLRRIEGMPQRQIAEKMGIPEHIVEAQSVRGLKLIIRALEEEGWDRNERPGRSPRTKKEKQIG